MINSRAYSCANGAAFLYEYAPDTGLQIQRRLSHDPKREPTEQQADVDCRIDLLRDDDDMMTSGVRCRTH